MTFADTSSTTPSLHLIDHHKTGTCNYPQSPGLFFSKNSNPMKKWNALDLVFLNEFSRNYLRTQSQPTSWLSTATSKSLKVKAIHSWGLLRSSVAGRKAKCLQRFAILLPACLVQKCPLWEFPSFPLSISRFWNHSFHLFFLCPTTLASLMLSHPVAQLQGIACTWPLHSNLSTSLEISQQIKLNAHSAFVTVRQSSHRRRNVHM